MTDSPPVTFSTAYKGNPKGSRYEHWRDEICRGFCRVDIDPGHDGTIEMHSRFANLHPVAIGIAKGRSAIVGRHAETVTDGIGDFALVCNPQTRLQFLYRNEALSVAPGQICLSDMTKPSSAVLDDGEFTALRINRQALIDVCPTAEAQSFLPKHVPQDLNEMIGRYAALAVKSAPHLDAHGRFLMGQHLVDLTSLALGARPDDRERASQRGQAEARLALMKSDILNRLGRPDLSIGVVAQRYKLSARQAQRLFEQSGTTFTDFLLEHRLRAARKLLADPVHRWRKISDIAHSAGFADLSYFNRVFRRRFGATPSEMRWRP